MNEQNKAARARVQVQLEDDLRFHMTNDLGKSLIDVQSEMDTLDDMAVALRRFIREWQSSIEALHTAGNVKLDAVDVADGIFESMPHGVMRLTTAALLANYIEREISE